MALVVSRLLGTVSAGVMVARDEPGRSVPGACFLLRDRDHAGDLVVPRGYEPANLASERCARPQILNQISQNPGLGQATRARATADTTHVRLTDSDSVTVFTENH